MALSILILNDGSTDATGDVAARIASSHENTTVLTNEHNMGYGATVMRALVSLRGEPVDAAVCLHADGQYAPEKMPELLAALHGRDLDVVQGSRHASGGALAGNMPLYKYVAGHILTLMENITFRLKMTDYHSGYLCYSRRALDVIPFERLSASFDFDLEAIASARALGLRVGEIPIPTHYGDEVSHLNPITYGFRVLRVMLRHLVGRYRCLDLERRCRAKEE